MTGYVPVPRMRLGAYSLGFLTNYPLKRALAGVGYDIVSGPTSPSIDGVAVWGDRPVARRAHAAAKRRGVPPVFIEDAFIRSVTPQERAPVIGLTIDHKAPYFDANRPSDLEDLLNATTKSDGQSPALDAYLNSGLSKYNDARMVPDDLEPGSFVLVVDQVRGDASISAGQASEKSFGSALAAALDENPGVPVLIKAHPRASDGHFAGLPNDERVRFLPNGVDPVVLLQRASQVFCVSSQMGFEAILHGQRPRVFGAPFYAGWGLSDDEIPVERRRAVLDRAAIFDTVFQKYCKWFDPLTGAPVPLLNALRGVEARARHYHLTRGIGVATGMKPWKRPWMRKVLPGVSFAVAGRAARSASQRNVDCVVWASQISTALQQDCSEIRVRLFQMEDGFLRSRGLGAALTPPGSVVIDDEGIYFDPRHASRLERLIASRAQMTAAQDTRARELISAITASGVSKYNLGGAAPAEFPGSPGKKRILVPGQVEDDASILLGATATATNLSLLRAARSANPDAYLIYKPHPDVEAGLRIGVIPDMAVADLADHVMQNGDPIAAITSVDEVWTMTSLLGFEALLRGVPVVCLGQPFYSGWGLTQDHGGKTGRRNANVTLAGLVHAALIDYPTYLDLASGTVLSVEDYVDGLVRGSVSSTKPGVASVVQRMWRNLSGPSKL